MPTEGYWLPSHIKHQPISSSFATDSQQPSVFWKQTWRLLLLISIHFILFSKYVKYILINFKSFVSQHQFFCKYYLYQVQKVILLDKSRISCQQTCYEKYATKLANITRNRNAQKLIYDQISSIVLQTLPISLFKSQSDFLLIHYIISVLVGCGSQHQEHQGRLHT